jgi:hypothetical protein
MNLTVERIVINRSVLIIIKTFVYLLKKPNCLSPLNFLNYQTDEKFFNQQIIDDNI